MKVLNEAVQARDEETGDLITGKLVLGFDDGNGNAIVVFVPDEETSFDEQPSEAVKGSLGEYEEVEEPVATE